MDWSTLFQPQVVKSGRHSLEQGLVYDFQSSAHWLKAVVHDTHNYRVKITVNEDRITDANCDCPNAPKGSYCKHMAAVLFYRDEVYYRQAPTTADINKLVVEATDEQIRTFLHQMLIDDDRLATLFFLQIASLSATEKFHRYQFIVESIFDDYQDRSEYINYDNAPLFEMDLNKFVSQSIGWLIKTHDLELAFRLVNDIFMKLVHLDIDDSGGETVMNIQTCVAVWTEIVHQADLPLQQRAFDWFKAHATKSLDFFAEPLEEMLIMQFQGHSFLEQKLTWITQRIKQERQKNRDINSDQVKKWTTYYAQIMEALDVAPIEDDN